MNIRKMLIVLTVIGISGTVFAGCGTKHVTKNTKPSVSTATEILLNEDSYGMILTGPDNSYDDCEAEGFEEIMKEAGRSSIILRPDDLFATSQQKLVRELIEQHVSAIAIAPNDAEALSGVLKEAMEQGIDVCTFDKPGDPEARELYINPSGTYQIARTLMDAVCELADGKGQWAILSVSASDDRQGGWIDSMRSLMKEETYLGLELLEIAYGSDLYQNSYDQTRALLQNYQDLKVICATSPIGLKAASDAVTDLQADVQITGFGLPSMMNGLIGEECVCPWFFLRNPLNAGQIAAYVSIALRGNQITGALGEKFIAGELGEYTVTQAGDGGTEVIIGSPVRIDKNNIAGWSDLL